MTDAADGPALRALRMRHNISLRQIAETTGISHSHLSKVERGDRPVSAQAHAAYLRAVDVVNDFVKDLARRYTGGASIRALAASTGRSYGFVHKVLTDAGVQLRERGGQTGRATDRRHLVAALAAHHPGRQLTYAQAEATLRDALAGWWQRRVEEACNVHNDQIARNGDLRASRPPSAPR